MSNDNRPPMSPFGAALFEALKPVKISDEGLVLEKKPTARIENRCDACDKPATHKHVTNLGNEYACDACWNAAHPPESEELDDWTHARNNHRGMA